MYKLKFSILLLGCLLLAPEIQAQTCTPAPSCAELGYTKSVADCAGKTILYCPFDRTKAYCNDETSCAALGFTDTISECPGEYTRCPSDSTKGKCIFEASPGDLKYSLRTSDHNGWMLCDGRAYSEEKYPELYAAIKDSYGTYLPSYSGYFIKGAATSVAANLRKYEAAGLPNITGYMYGMGLFRDLVNMTQNVTASGGLYKYSTSASDWAGGSNMHGYTLQVGIGLDASKSNSIYGKSTTVTPRNYSANVFIYTGRKKADVADVWECPICAYLNTLGSGTKHECELCGYVYEN